MERESKAEKPALNLVKGREKERKHPEILDLGRRGTVYPKERGYEDEKYHVEKKNMSMST